MGSEGMRVPSKPHSTPQPMLLVPGPKLDAEHYHADRARAWLRIAVCTEMRDRMPTCSGGFGRTQAPHVLIVRTGLARRSPQDEVVPPRLRPMRNGMRRTPLHAA
jgi:hypothetical protein